VTVQGEDAEGYEAEIYTRAEEEALGNAGDITITAQSLRVLDGAVIYANTESTTNAGNILLNVQDVEVRGMNLEANNTRREPSQIQSSVVPGATGRGGDLTINGDRLVLAQGGTLSTATLSSGNAGNISLNVGAIAVEGLAQPQSSNILPGIFAGSVLSRNSAGERLVPTGNAGTIRIQADTLQVTNGGNISSYTEGEGNAGNMQISARSVDVVGSGYAGQVLLPSSINANVAGLGTGQGGLVQVQADQLRLLAGGQISSSTFWQGDASDVEIRARSVLLSGSSGRLASGLYANAAGSTGQGGDIRVFTQDLDILDGAVINVGNFETRFSNIPPGQGEAGGVEIVASQVRLRNGGTINVDGLNGDRGNIRLQSGLLDMRNSALLTATARGAGNGGNINLNATFILGFQNSDIIANAQQGRGGNIQIVTQGIFGLQYRDQRTPKSDITASSKFGLSGSVQISGPRIDPSNGLNALTTDLLDPSQQMAQTCAEHQGGRFVVTGRGGLPSSPTGPEVQTTWVDMRPQPSLAARSGPAAPPPIAAAAPLQEASLWQRDVQGQVQLIAATALPDQIEVTCSGAIAVSPKTP
jgi:large exoprotein involved in heme utilization and adhesion